jgi:hypothetical protein
VQILPDLAALIVRSCSRHASARYRDSCRRSRFDPCRQKRDQAFGTNASGFVPDQHQGLLHLCSLLACTRTGRRWLPCFRMIEQPHGICAVIACGAGKSIQQFLFLGSGCAAILWRHLRKHFPFGPKTQSHALDPPPLAPPRTSLQRRSDNDILSGFTSFLPWCSQFSTAPFSFSAVCDEQGDDGTEQTPLFNQAVSVWHQKKEDF